MKRLPIPLFALLGACAGAVVGPDPDAAREERALGDEAYRRGEYQVAIEHYTGAIGYNPDYAEAYYWRGNAYTHLEERPDQKTLTRELRMQALADYSLAIAKNPAHFDATYNRALLAASFRNYKQAAADLLECTRIRPNDPEPHLLVGQLYESKFEDMGLKAIEHYEQYVRLGGTNADIIEKVKAWQAIKPKTPEGAAPKAPTEEEEAKAKDLHNQLVALIGQGKNDEAFKVLDDLLTKFGHTKYVRQSIGAFTAMHRALKPPEKK